MRLPTPRPNAATETLEGHEPAFALFAPLTAGSVIGARYEIVALLGRGGYSTVYRARDRQLGRDIALKILRPERVTPSTMSRLRREVNIARDAVSPHLVRVFDLGVEGETVFLTMELVDGESLRQRLARQRCLPIAEAADVGAQILRGLAALHAMKAIHRDIKPENVLIAADGTVKLADFGLARGLDDEQSRTTMAGSVVGTADYVSPEQALGQPLDERADLYAVGIVLFEMVAGELPFARDSSLGSMLARVRTRARGVRSLRGDVPYWLAMIIARLLERDPPRRYRTAGEVATALASRRADVRSLLPRARTLAITAAVVVAAIFGFMHINAARRQIGFVRLAAHGTRGIVAIGRNGETLWQRDGVDYGIAKDRWALVRVRRNEPPLLAAVLTQRGEFHLEKVLKLSFLNPDTGALVKEVALPGGAVDVGLASRRYWPYTLASADVDGDGIDEVFITYVHLPEAPSFIVLYEPLLDRSRVLYQAVGHYLFAGLKDVDGDGRPEALLLGINNAFDWMNVLTAVRIVPWIREPAATFDAITRSPDLVEHPYDEANTLWHAVLPRFWFPEIAPALSFDDSNRRIIINAPDRRVEVTFDGFLVNDRSKIDSRRRNELRNTAYAHFREARRLIDVGAKDAALLEMAAAVASATGAEEPILVEVMRRMQAAMLIQYGDAAAGERLSMELWRQSENRSEVAYEAAVANHLRGELGRAVAWYERGMAAGGSQAAGKSKHEFIQGIVLALAEAKQWDAADAAIARFHTAYNHGGKPDWTGVYDEYVRWRRGEMPRVEDLRFDWYTVDLARYWQLEFRLARGEAVSLLLPSVESEVDVGAQPQSVWRSLHAELLWRAGRKADAAAEALRARGELEREATRNIIARGHADLVRERVARIAGGKN